MPSFWQRVSIELHTIFGLLDDMGDISSALVITVATLKVAVAFFRTRTRRAHVTCTLSHPRRRRRRHRRPHCVNQHRGAFSAQRYETKAHAPDRHKTA